MKKLLTILGVIFMTSQVSAADMDAKTLVEQANKNWNSAFNSGDTAGLSALYAEQATLSPGDGSVLEGRDAIKALFDNFKSNGVHNHQITTHSVIADDKQLTQVGYWKAEGLNAEQEAISFGGVLVTTLQKNDAGNWLLHTHVWNMKP